MAALVELFVDWKDAFGFRVTFDEDEDVVELAVDDEDGEDAQQYLNIYQSASR